MATRKGIHISGHYIISINAIFLFIFNSMFARLGTDYEMRNQCFFAILEAVTTD